MIDSMKRAAVAAVLGSAMTLAPAPAQAFLTLPKSQVKLDDSVDLKKQLERTNAQLAEIQKSLDRLSTLMNGRVDEKGYAVPTEPGVVANIKELKDKINELNSLKQQVEALQKEVANLKTSTSLRPATQAQNLDLMAGKGTVRIVNEYPVEVQMVINNMSYTVAPRRSVDVTVPAGRFTYQLLTATTGSSPKESDIREKDVMTLRVR